MFGGILAPKRGITATTIGVSGTRLTWLRSSTISARTVGNSSASRRTARGQTLGHLRSGQPVDIRLSSSAASHSLAAAGPCLRWLEHGLSVVWSVRAALTPKGRRATLMRSGATGPVQQDKHRAPVSFMGAVGEQHAPLPRLHKYYTARMLHLLTAQNAPLIVLARPPGLVALDAERVAVGGARARCPLSRVWLGLEPHLGTIPNACGPAPHRSP